jgi:predicted nucleic acid-binding Zn ribbon protein
VPRKPPFDPLAVATAPRSPAARSPEPPAPPDIEAVTHLIARHCKVCGAATKNKTGLCLEHQRQLLSLKEEQAIVRDAITKNGHRYAELHMTAA